jgi:hypothetical protein
MHMSVIHTGQRAMLFDEHSYRTFLFKSATVTGDTFLAMMEKVFCVMSLREQFSSQMAHHLTSAVWTSSFLITG